LCSASPISASEPAHQPIVSSAATTSRLTIVAIVSLRETT
jgi:hypothetical protein